ncbi:MAG: hypothetical protein VX473_02090 [Candidatus Thermoplasmatota archaeon]|nr:hypothetical protein [Candidatus Thermoplasmatota archaeon]
MREGLAGTLQHPRRSLGDRYRSQAIKFLKLADSDPDRSPENTVWAEQNCRQALLYDFTHPDNWRTLAKIKVHLSDEIGLRALLSDLFTVLGRDPEHISQLDGVSILDVGSELLEAALSNDHLDPDIWHENIDDDGIHIFCNRFQTLDLTDPRCNVLFGRRVERLWDTAGDDICIPLARILLSNRPQNFEMWADLGRAHERRGAHDEAWFCYDQAQSYGPHLDLRDSFKQRMESQMETGKVSPWTQPTIEIRDEFLSKMQVLASRFHKPTIETVSQSVEDTTDNEDEMELKMLLENGQYSTAFFLARRLLTRGETWAQSYLDEAQNGLDSDDIVNIP